MSAEIESPQDTGFVPSRLHIGAAYYPEHWPETRWPDDVRLMRELGLSVVRMGEFAWSTLEPAAGQFDFDWLDRAIDMLADAGVATVLGTPTAGPPAWLTAALPDTLVMDEYGRRAQHGNRCHYCVTSPDFHAATRRIVAAMGEHFGSHPQVIGWQLDNEFSTVCYCPRCRALFQQFLKDAYGSLDALNERWSTRYWSQTYSAWEQIPIPIGGHNPGLMLEFQHFVTETYRRFARVQLDALRPHLRPGVWVTHNFMGWYQGFDHYRMSEDLDMASWDWYVGTGHNDYLKSGATHELTRGFKRQNYWVMETQPGCVNWSSVNNTLNRGETRAMAWHAVAHGADAVLYWQWRTALSGQEQYHGTLVDQSGQPRLLYREIRQLAVELERASPLLAGSKPAEARVAILNDYDSRWSLEWQRHHRDFDYVAHLLSYYRPIAARNIPVEIISADAPIDGYKLVIAPAMLILTEERAERLRKFVSRGRNLLLTARCAMKDAYNALLPSRQPGPLTDMAGVEVEDYYALDEDVPIKGNWFTGVSRQWAERLHVLEGAHAATIARYGPSNGWLDGQPAITVNAYKGGMVYLCGAYLDDAAQDSFIARLLQNCALRPQMEMPEGIEIGRRMTVDGQEAVILINHKPTGQDITLPWPAFEHLNRLSLEGEITLGPYGVLVLTKEEPPQPEEPAQPDQTPAGEDVTDAEAAPPSTPAQDDSTPVTPSSP